LIYLGPVLQKRVLPIFNYALKPSGLLLLGKSESLGLFSDLFIPWDRKSKIYAKAAATVQAQAYFSATNYPIEAVARDGSENRDGANVPNMLKEADNYVLEKRSPAGVIIDEGMNIV